MRLDTQIVMISHKIKIDDVNYQIVELTPLHFLEMQGIPFSIFSTETKEEGAFARITEALEDIEEEKPINYDMINAVINIAVINNNLTDFHNSLKNKWDKDVFDNHLLKLFSKILELSCKTFKKVYHPNRDLLINCHCLAKNYGGTPSDYIKLPIDEFLFNTTSLLVGAEEEKAQIERARKAQKR